MSEKGTTGDSRRKSGEKRGEARKRLGEQKRSSDNVRNLMEKVAQRETTGFSDTDKQVLAAADRIGTSAERVGREDAQATRTASDALKAHGDEMGQKAKHAAAESAKVDRINANDARIQGVSDLRKGYTQAEAVASDIARGDQQEASATKNEAHSLQEYVKAAARRRPSFD
jgi:hypothetical protein